MTRKEKGGGTLKRYDFNDVNGVSLKGIYSLPWSYTVLASRPSYGVRRSHKCNLKQSHNTAS